MQTNVENEQFHTKLHTFLEVLREKTTINVEGDSFEKIEFDGGEYWWRELTQDRNLKLNKLEVEVGVNYFFAEYYPGDSFDPKNNEIQPESCLRKFFLLPEEDSLVDCEYEKFPESEEQISIYKKKFLSVDYLQRNKNKAKVCIKSPGFKQTTYYEYDSLYYENYTKKNVGDRIVAEDKGGLLIGCRYEDENEKFFTLFETAPNSGIFQLFAGESNTLAQRNIINELLQARVIGHNAWEDSESGGICNEEVIGYIFANADMDNNKIIMPYCNDGYWYKVFEEEFNKMNNDELIIDLGIRNNIDYQKDFAIVPIKFHGHFVTFIIYLLDNSIYLFDSSTTTLGKWTKDENNEDLHEYNPNEDGVNETLYGNLNIEILNTLDLQGNSGTCGFYTAAFCVEASRCQSFDELKSLCESGEMQARVAKRVSNIIDNGVKKEANKPINEEEFEINYRNIIYDEEKYKIPNNTLCVNKSAFSEEVRKSLFEAKESEKAFILNAFSNSEKVSPNSRRLSEADQEISETLYVSRPAVKRRRNTCNKTVANHKLSNNNKFKEKFSSDFPLSSPTKIGAVKTNPEPQFTNNNNIA